MAIVLKDRVKETTAVTGTGTATLLGAAAGYQAFSVIGNGNITYYAIVSPEDGTWEVGTGTYTTSGNTLSRTTVFESSNGGALVDFAVGVKDVFITYPAERAIFEEPDGQTLIDGGPITILGNGVTINPTLEAELGKFVGNVDSFGQVYNLNQNDGSNASADFVAYNDLTTDGFNYFTDMGISSSNYTSVDYPLFTPNSGYIFHGGDDFFVGNQTTGKDVVLFAGGVDTVNEAVRIKGADQSVELASGLTVAGAATITGAAEFQSTVLLDADPTLALQAATKQYVDNATSNGFHVHTPVFVATTGNLTATYNQPGGAGDGVGATLTNSGTQVALEIDGVAMTVADRVLVWQQTTGLQNGIYVVTTVGSGATNWVLTRSADANTSSEGDPNSLGGGDYFFVQSGDTLGYHSYICTNTAAIIFGTTAITFNEFSSTPQYIGGTNITVDGSTISLSGTVAATNGGTGTSTVTTGDLLYGSGTNTWGKLAAGSAYKSLVMNSGGTQVEWNAVALNQSGAVSGSLPATNGGTGQNAYSVGDMLYSGTVNELTKLSGNTTTTKKFLTQTGTGTDSAAPSWGTISGSDVTSAVSTATNLAGGGANQIAYQTAAGTTNFLSAPVTSNTALIWNGTALAWGSAGAPSISDDTTTNATYYPVWANGTSGALTTAYVSSTKLSFNPSTGTLGATNFSGAWAGSTIAVTRGGTGVTTSTGSGSVVLSTSPSFSTSVLLAGATQPYIQLNSSNYTTTYPSSFGVLSSAEGDLRFGNNGTNTIVAGTQAAGGTLRFVVNNTTAFPTAVNGTTALTLASTGAATFANTVNATTFSGALSGNASTATNLSTTRTNWSTNGTITAVVGQMSWKNYGNNHTIFDASASTSPDGGAVNNTNAQIAWSGTYPTLMGWNGANTYGVRVDSARVADSASNASYASSAGSAGSATNAGYATNAGSATNASYAGTTPASGITGQTGMWTSAARPGPYRLYRNDGNDPYNIQTTWSADRSNYWSLRGYYNDSYHAACFVAYSGYADSAGSASSATNASYASSAGYATAAGYATQTYGDVGSYVLMSRTGTGTTTAGGDYSGSTLRTCAMRSTASSGIVAGTSFGLAITGTFLGGTWRFMGNGGAETTLYGVGIWLRVA